jgi:acetylornithine/succinyldiaminopimelate/putrescine aminotransferase
VTSAEPVAAEEVRAVEARYVMQTYKRGPVEFVRGEGATLYDSEGEAYLDFLAGISVCNAGHCHPEVVEAVREQAGRLMHASNLFYSEPGVRLAERSGDQARAEVAPRRGDHRARGRLPRPHDGGALGDAPA